MKRKIRTFIINKDSFILSMVAVSLCFVCLSGCKKFLDQQPDNRASLNTPDKVSQLLTAAYPDRDYITFCESLSDNVADRGYQTQYVPAQPNDNPYRFKDFPSKDMGTSEGYWGACYKAIAAANQALEACNKASNQEAYSAYKGEALVARAYAHFMLVSLFAKTYDPISAATEPGIPYVDEPENTFYKTYERKTVAYVYDRIDQDLIAGIPLLRNGAYKVSAYRFNTSAAHAFAARFYLFRQQYDKVIEHADLTFSDNIVSHLRPWNTVYNSMSELDMQKRYTESTEKANLLLGTANSNWRYNWQYFRYGLSLNKFFEIFNDTKITAGTTTFKVLTYGVSGQMIGISKWRPNDVKAGEGIVTPYIYIPLLTSEEVLFNKAEALVSVGKYDEAIALLNIYQSTRINNYNTAIHTLTGKNVNAFFKTNDVKTGLIKAILALKRMEFVQEGMRWFDILRHKIPVTHIDEDKMQYDLRPDDPRRVLQIPENAQTNGGLAPNPR